jgi:hypothetical protein
MMMAWHLYKKAELEDMVCPPSFKKLMSVDKLGRVVAGPNIPTWLGTSLPQNVLQAMEICCRLHKILQRHKLTNQGMISENGKMWPRTKELQLYLLNQGPKPPGNEGEHIQFFPHPDGHRLLPPTPDFLNLKDDYDATSTI